MSYLIEYSDSVNNNTSDRHPDLNMQRRGFIAQTNINMPSNRRLPYLLLLICICTHTFAAATEGIWLYAKPVTFISNHDVARIKLEAHTPIDLDDVIYHSDSNSTYPLFNQSQNLTYNDVNQWESGREINIAYSSTCGAVLLDPSSGKYIEIIDGLAEHPLDSIYQGNIGAGSTMEMVIAANEIIELWKLEIARIYGRLRIEYQNDLELFNTAESQWNDHCAADLRAMSSATSDAGTIHSILSGNDRITLYRNHALRLAKWGRF
jgi:hypothetical protein